MVISNKTLEDFLKSARHKEYSKYEESFKDDNFELRRGSSKLSHGHIDITTGKPERFFNLIMEVYEGKIDINVLIKSESDSNI